MLFTQGQVRSLLEIPFETLRRWREHIPALARHKGHAPSFTPGDVVALALISDLVAQYGVRPNALASSFDSLVQACHGCSWMMLETCVAVFDATGVRLLQASDARRDLGEGLILSAPCRPLVERLRARLVDVEPEAVQPGLQFPPVPVRGGR